MFWAYIAFDINCFPCHSEIHNNFKKILKICEIFTNNLRHAFTSPKNKYKKSHSYVLAKWSLKKIIIGSSIEDY